MNPIKLSQQVLDRAIAIQQIPAPTFKEAERASFVCESFAAEGLVDVFRDEIGNVYGRLPGSDRAAPLVVSAHLDTVFPAATDLTLCRQSERLCGPGIGDNSVGIAGLFGVIWGLRQRAATLPGDLWLVANVGEEGLGNLNGMRAVVRRFGSGVRAYIVLEGMALGQVYHRGLGVQRYRITVQTAGGHSWVDFGRPSAVHKLAEIITQFNAICLPEKPRTTLNVGVIRGGMTVNTIAAEASLELDLRSEEAGALKSLAAEVEAIVRGAHRGEIDVEAEIIGARPAGQLPVEHPLVRLAVRCLERQGIAPHLNVGSTDANIPLSQGIPAICVGLTNGSGAHTVGEFIYTQPLTRGLAQLIDLVEQVYYLPDDNSARDRLRQPR